MTDCAGNSQKYTAASTLRQTDGRMLDAERPHGAENGDVLFLKYLRYTTVV